MKPFHFRSCAGRFSQVVLGSVCIASLLFVPSSTRAQSTLTPGIGSVEFTTKLRGGQPSFLKSQILFRGVASDGNERIEGKVLAGDLIVIRDVRPCLRLSARVPDAIKPGRSQRVAIRWNKASASVTVDNREVALEPSQADKFHRFASSRIMAGSQDIEVRDLAMDRLGVLAESASDRRFLDQANCFDPHARPANGSAIVVHRGIELRGFSQPGQIDAIKRWIDAMTPEMLSAVRSVSVTAEGAQTWRGLSVPMQRSILLRPEIVSESRVFFHEGAHLLDSLHGWRDSRDWGVQFMHLPRGAASFSPGAVGHLDASSPGEQLAEAVGLAKTEAMGLAGARACERDDNCAEKMKFLAVRGYLSQTEAEAVANRRSPLKGPATMSLPRSTPLKATLPAHRSPEPNPYYETETIVPMQGVATIDIILDKRYFRPIDIYHDGGRTVPPTWRGCKVDDVMNRLTRSKPSAIVSEPPLKGGLRKYGYFDFGMTKNRRHYLAMEEMADGTIQMHFDMKGNGRLDDTLPKMGQFRKGEKAFATLIEFPWSYLMDNAPFEGYFKLWFISNASEWAISGFTKSSRTQLQGAIRLNGQQYDLIVADTAFSDNDGILTNDGLCLRKTGQKATCWNDDEVKAGIILEGRRYAFNVRLPAVSGR